MLAADRGYVALLRLRGAGPLWLWTSLARLQYGVLPLALLLLLAERRHSFAEAGTTLAGYGLAAGLLGPFRARLADRAGVRRVLVVLAVLLALALTGLTVAADAPLAVTLFLAVLAGSVPPPVGPVMRAAWRRMAGDDQDLLRRAYSFDAVGEEVLYVLGPLVAAAAAASLGPRTAVLGSAGLLVLAAAGTAACLPKGQRPVAPRSRAGSRRRGVAGLAPVAGLGFLLGGLEVAGVAAALAAARPSAAGLPAAAVSVGSVIGGLLYGRRRWPGDHGSQARLLACAAAVAVALAATCTANVDLMVGVLSLAGLFIAPAIVSSYLLADESAAAGSTEATAWVNASFNACLALGSAAAGVVVDAASPRLAMLVLAGVASVVVLVPRPAD